MVKATQKEVSVTVRGITPSMKKWLEREAKSSRRSVNATILTILQQCIEGGGES